MLTLFEFQLIVSFLVGGSLIAVLSLVAESAPPKIAGVVLSLPSTIAISLLFISWTIGSEKIREVAVVAPAIMGVILLFAIVYLYLSKLPIANKSFAILLSTTASLGVWFAFAIPIATFELNNLALSLGIYFIGLLLAYLFITRPALTQGTLKPRTYTHGQKIFRAVFAGTMVSLAVYFSKTLSPFWGGIFSAFPAVYTSTLVIMHWYYDSNFLFRIFKTAPLGSIPLTLFSVAAMYTFPALGTILGLITAYLICLIGFGILLKALQK